LGLSKTYGASRSGREPNQLFLSRTPPVAIAGRLTADVSADGATRPLKMRLRSAD